MNIPAQAEAWTSTLKSPMNTIVWVTPPGKDQNALGGGMGSHLYKERKGGPATEPTTVLELLYTASCPWEPCAAAVGWPKDQPTRKATTARNIRFDANRAAIFILPLLTSRKSMKFSLENEVS